MRTASSQFRVAGVVPLALATTALCLALAGCGSPSGTASAASAAASPTPTCPPSQTAASVKFVTGKITAVANGTITVAPTSGAAVTMQITSTTRLTKLAPTTVSAIQVGDVTQITPDASGVIATRIMVTRAAGAFGGGAPANGGQPSATRTPGARFNPACFRRGNQAGGPFGAAGGQGGRVTAISSSQIAVTDAQGAALTYSITSSTVVVAPAAATPADLVVGASVNATGATSGSAIVARSITITPAGQ